MKRFLFSSKKLHWNRTWNSSQISPALHKLQVVSRAVFLYRLSTTGSLWLPVLNWHNALLWRKFNFVRYFSKPCCILIILYITHFLFLQISMFHSWRYWSFDCCKIVFRKRVFGTHCCWLYHKKGFPLLHIIDLILISHGESYVAWVLRTS